MPHFNMTQGVGINQTVQFFHLNDGLCGLQAIYK